MPIISCKNLGFDYEGKTVLSGVTFDLAKGEYLCIAGENGSGKSTLIKGLLGLKAPSEGVLEFPDGLKRSEIGYLPQQTLIQKDFPSSAEEIVLSGCLNGSVWRPFYSKEDKKTADANMERMGVLDLKKRCFRELSGGQQRRVLLARALCAAKRLLILDEPVSGLDPAAAQELYAAVLGLNREKGMAILMVSHDLGAALCYSDKILRLGGCVPAVFSAEEFAKSEEGKRFVSGGKRV